MQHLIDLDDYPVSWWNRVIALGKDIYTNPGRYKGACAGKVMGTLFTSHLQEHRCHSRQPC